MKKIVAEIRRRVEAMPEQDRILIAIDGSCTSGKSTLAALLAEEFDGHVFHMDDFFLRPAQRTPERLAEVGGNVDYERFREEVLIPLKNGDPVAYRPYDCGTGNLKEPVKAAPKGIHIIEGSYSQHPYFGNVYDLRVVLKVSPAVRLQRIMERPGFLQKRFLEEWIPMEQQYFEAFAIEDNADLVAWPKDNL